MSTTVTLFKKLTSLTYAIKSDFNKIKINLLEDKSNSIYNLISKYNTNYNIKKYNTFSIDINNIPMYIDRLNNSEVISHTLDTTYKQKICVIPIRDISYNKLSIDMKNFNHSNYDESFSSVKKASAIFILLESGNFTDSDLLEFEISFKNVGDISIPVFILDGNSNDIKISKKNSLLSSNSNNEIDLTDGYKIFYKGFEYELVYGSYLNNSYESSLDSSNKYYNDYSLNNLFLVKSSNKISSLAEDRIFIMDNKTPIKKSYINNYSRDNKDYVTVFTNNDLFLPVKSFELSSKVSYSSYNLNYHNQRINNYCNISSDENYMLIINSNCSSPMVIGDMSDYEIIENPSVSNILTFKDKPFEYDSGSYKSLKYPVFKNIRVNGPLSGLKCGTIISNVVELSTTNDTDFIVNVGIFNTKIRASVYVDKVNKIITAKTTNNISSLTYTENSPIHILFGCWIKFNKIFFRVYVRNISENTFLDISDSFDSIIDTSIIKYSVEKTHEVFDKWSPSLQFVISDKNEQTINSNNTIKLHPTIIKHSLEYSEVNDYFINPKIKLESLDDPNGDILSDNIKVNGSEKYITNNHNSLINVIRYWHKNNSTNSIYHDIGEIIRKDNVVPIDTIPSLLSSISVASDGVYKISLRYSETLLDKNTKKNISLISGLNYLDNDNTEELNNELSLSGYANKYETLDNNNSVTRNSYLKSNANIVFDPIEDVNTNSSFSLINIVKVKYYRDRNMKNSFNYRKWMIVKKYFFNNSLDNEGFINA